MDTSLVLILLYSFAAAGLRLSSAYSDAGEARLSALHSSSGLHPVRENRMRRAAGGHYGPSPEEYMESIRQQLASSEDTKDVAVCGIMDTDVVHDNYKASPKNSKCRLAQVFRFPVRTLVREYATMDDVLPFTTAILRVYIQTIPRHLPHPGDNFTVNIDVLTNLLDQANNSMQADFLADSQMIPASPDMEEDLWLEIDITTGITNLNLSKSLQECSIEVKVIFSLDLCTKMYKKVPLKVVDPSNVPVENTKRRERLLAVQPLLVFYVIEDETMMEKNYLMDS